MEKAGDIVCGETGLTDAGGGDDVAMTRNVVRSKRMTSVALHACARTVRCLDSTVAFGIRVCTIRDQA